MTDWLFQALAGSAIVMVVVMALRPWVLRWFGPSMVYGLWLLPVLRLALPARPIWTIQTPVSPAFERGAIDLMTVIPSQAEAGTGILSPATVVGALAMLWAVGAAIHLGLGLFAYLRFVQRAREASVGEAQTIDGVALCASAVVTGPVATGIWRRRIFVPLDFDRRFDPDQRALALAHERTHHRRHDIAWNFVALVTVSVHWFNPFAHHAYRLYRLDQEMACDRDVMSAAPGFRQAYGRLLTQASWTGGASPACGLGAATLIKQRLIALTRPPGLSPRQAATILVPLALAAVLATAPLNVTGGDVTASIVSAVIPPSATPVDAREPFISVKPGTAAPERASLAPPRSSLGGRSPVSVNAADEPATTFTDPVEDRTSADHLARRRAAGLLRSRPQLEDPAGAARRRGRPVFTSLSPEP